MNLLLHACCGPCLVYPATELLFEGFDFTVYFYNPNIHPFQEFKKRKTTLRDFCLSRQLPFIVNGEYGLRHFLRHVVFHEDDRCTFCYSDRLEQSARYACQNGFTGFSTTLLYSKYQNHEQIADIGTSIGQKYGLEFIYRDFRKGWQQGIQQSKELQMYRQPYCGCIYSEQERYDTSLCQ